MIVAGFSVEGVNRNHCFSSLKRYIKRKRKKTIYVQTNYETNKLLKKVFLVVVKKITWVNLKLDH